MNTYRGAFFGRWIRARIAIFTRLVDVTVTPILITTKATEVYDVPSRMFLAARRYCYTVAPDNHIDSAVQESISNCMFEASKTHAIAASRLLYLLVTRPCSK